MESRGCWSVGRDLAYVLFDLPCFMRRDAEYGFVGVDVVLPAHAGDAVDFERLVGGHGLCRDEADAAVREAGHSDVVGVWHDVGEGWLRGMIHRSPVA